MSQSVSESWTDRIARIQRESFLVGPLQEIQDIPDGFELTVTRVVLDVEGETYWVGRSKAGEERGLGKSAIERIATAAAATAKVTRTDDRSHPRRCEYTAVAVMRLLDGTPQYAEASRAYDMTPEGTDWISIFDAAAEKAYEKAKEGGAEDDAASIAARKAGESAAFAALGAMHRNAETKSRLRALRTVLGLRSKYLRSELEKKSFAVMRLSATGRSADPVLRREFGRMLFANAIGASNALFGPQAGAALAVSRALPAPAAPAPHALPAPDESEIDEPDEDESPQGNPGRPSSAPPAPAASPPGNGGASSGASGPSPAAASPAGPSGPPARSEAAIPKGLPHEGRRLCDLDVAALTEVSTRMKTGIEAARAKNAPAAALRKAEAFLDLVATEMDILRGATNAELGRAESDDAFLAGLGGES